MTGNLKRFLGVAVVHRAVELAAERDRHSHSAPHRGAAGEVGKGMKPKMRYFIKVDADAKSDERMKSQSLHRQGAGGNGEILLEQWDRDKGEWMDDPTPMAACGIGDDEDYVEIEGWRAVQDLLDEWEWSELKRERLGFLPKAQERGGPGSGHHGHKGRPGKVGGSSPRLDGLTRPIGQCYFTAGQWMMKNARQIDNARLAHGTAVGQGPIEDVKFGHAWIEIGDAIAIDAETGMTLLKERYYEGEDTTAIKAN